MAPKIQEKVSTAPLATTPKRHINNWSALNLRNGEKFYPQNTIALARFNYSIEWRHFWPPYDPSDSQIALWTDQT